MPGPEQRGLTTGIVLGEPAIEKAEISTPTYALDRTDIQIIVEISGVHLVRPFHEPVDGAAVYDGGEHSEACSERLPQRRHAQHDVDVRPHAVDVLE